ncbi:amidase [Streptacidiphilus cavernicola]|uniref:Amidase n=1 Tax=Streptacidiphilus cavernicola TaxID=3342716 RepID=A0ABV6VMU9_9ACTN
MTSTELDGLDAVAMGAAVRRGELTPADLVEHCLSRIARFDAALGAFVTVTAEAARARAAEHPAAPAGDASPLAGVPTAVKDLIGTADTVTTFGSAAFRGFRPAVDAHTVTLLRRAGMISLGKTNTPEFGASPYTDNDVAPSARSPWDPARTAGGSSGGAAVAVAAGMVPVAHGSDGGGSLRIPASACGVFGFKPSRGRVSNGPLGNDVTGLSVQGPISRTVRDAAAMLDALAVPMPGDPFWAPPLPPGETFLAATGREPGRLRIACYAPQADPDCRTAFDRAAALLAELGHRVEPIDSPFGEDLVEPYLVTWAMQQLNVPVAAADEHLLRPVSRWWRERARGLSGESVFGALTALQLGARRAVAALAPYDAVLTPTLGTLPPPPGWFGEPEDRTGEIERQSAFSPYTAAFNITGQPSASLPLHWTAQGFPVGVMLTGRPAGDAALLSLCAQVEAAHPWAHRRPPLPGDPAPERPGA